MWVYTTKIKKGYSKINLIQLFFQYTDKDKQIKKIRINLSANFSLANKSTKIITVLFIFCYLNSDFF